jgi:hypothetical protein
MNKYRIAVKRGVKMNWTKGSMDDAVLFMPQMKAGWLMPYCDMVTTWGDRARAERIIEAEKEDAIRVAKRKPGKVTYIPM